MATKIEKCLLALMKNKTKYEKLVEHAEKFRSLRDPDAKEFRSPRDSGDKQEDSAANRNYALAIKMSEWFGHIPINEGKTIAYTNVGYMIKTNLLSYDVCMMALVHYYGENGRYKKLTKVSSMINKNHTTSTWNDCIKLLFQNYSIPEGFNLFAVMRRLCMTFDSGTLEAILTGYRIYNHEDVVDESCNAFQEMRACGVEPKMIHYVQLINILCNRGRHEEAYKLATSLPETNSSVWITLLNKCRDGKIGYLAISELRGVGGLQSAEYKTLKNYYALMGQYEKSEEIMEEMRRNKIPSKPSASWTPKI